ncbi:DUF1549 domain-containing protein [Rubinisphaera italica]|uniref:Planctomycete cytochrome C n=1 Tax=Rubinisphaera italica TaxID=2527969 RepID=A0A5C5XD55_9PLAN|nr:DUF1549 domain-containing protein [Rubinisphaera italica]TWT60704.1 Planctomycete cytochrome C [Rubinisphaera italica]
MYCQKKSFLLLIGFVLSLMNSPISNVVWGDEQPTSLQIQFFEKHVRPLLIEQCYKCHSEKMTKGGLRVDSRSALQLGGESGPAIEPGKPDASLLIEAVRYESYEMPPSQKLSEEQIAVLNKWIEMGAPWPGDHGDAELRPVGPTFTQEELNWWAFQPVTDPAPPTQLANEEWCHNEIDQFIGAKLDEQQLVPAPEADRAVLLRRLYFDLIGLPPTPEEVRAYEQDTNPQAYENVVDQLLSRPEYGERWARHWLDLVRYAESDGYRADNFRPQAWRYRDYVIESFNTDKPYDRFVQEQLAGDELFPDDPAALIATGFLRHGIFEYNVPDIRGQWDQILNEVTDVTGDVFFGLGFQCARCHDHKFDPILQKDYFRLRAFFEATLPRDDVIAATPEDKAKYAAQLAVYQENTREVQKQIDTLLEKPLLEVFEATIKRYPDDLKEVIRKSPEERTAHEQQLFQFANRLILHEQARVDGRVKGEKKDELLALRRELAKFDKLRPKDLPLPMIISDVGDAAPPTIIPKKKVQVAPGFPTIMEPDEPAISPPENIPNTTGRRAELASWLTETDNPLTTRNIVNRVWQYHFGRGLAANSSDFGQLGGTPTHPQLLDWLTSRFLDGGWQMKSLHRLIVTSATYRQSASHPQLMEFQQKDPTNRWYWRGDVRRLDAEQIRDSIFAVTGHLQSAGGGPSVPADRPRRSIYTRVMRNSHDPLMQVFDLPQFITSSSNRDSTTTPVQSLMLINSQVMLAHATTLAERVHAQSSNDDDAQLSLEKLWWIVFGREPSADELDQAKLFLDTQEQLRSNDRRDDGVPANVHTGQVPHRHGQAILFEDNPKQEQFQIPDHERLNVGDFTFEAIFQLRSIYDSGAVRTLGAKMARLDSRSGWLLGISGKGSRRKPQSLVLQIFGINGDGQQQEVVQFSDHQLEFNKPYYAAVSVKMATSDTPGKTTFHLKDLSNDEAPLSTIEFPNPLVSMVSNHDPLTIGSGRGGDRFDGLIDDIRLSNVALPNEELLYDSEEFTSSTIGYWQFEPNPGLLKESRPDGLSIVLGGRGPKFTSSYAAFIDLCHVLLNSNEFLYVR